jgi:uncharacterized membrane protein YkvA (DUF1232 family)
VDLPSALLIGLAVVVAAWQVLVAILWLHRPSRDLAMPIVRLVPDLARLVRALLADDTTPRSVKVVLGGLLVYLLSPIDLVPEVFPVIGSLDDVIIGGLVLRWAGRRIGAEHLRAHWSGSPEGFDLMRRFLGI